MRKKAKIQEKDMSGFYRSKFGLIPELLSPDVFVVKNSLMARLLYHMNRRKVWEGDWQIIQDCRDVLSEESFPLDKSYFIIDLGDAHLPGVAARALLPKNIDTYFFIVGHHARKFEEGTRQHNIMRQRSEYTLRFFAEENLRARHQIEEPNSLATLVDIHRLNPLPFGGLPKPEFLRELGIENVVYLKESFKGVVPEGRVSQFLEEPQFSEELVQEFNCAMTVTRRARPGEDMLPYLVKMRSLGFNLVLGGIDSRGDDPYDIDAYLF